MALIAPSLAFFYPNDDLRYNSCDGEEPDIVQCSPFQPIVRKGNQGAESNDAAPQQGTEPRVEEFIFRLVDHCSDQLQALFAGKGGFVLDIILHVTNYFER